MTRKPRSDSVLRNLPLEKREMLIAWLADEGISQAEARERIEKEFSLTVGKTAVSDFYREECLPIRTQRAMRTADGLREIMSAHPEKFDKLTVAALSQRLFELSLNPEANAQELAQLASIIGDSKRLTLRAEEIRVKETQTAQRLDLQAGQLDIAKRRVVLLEDNAAQAKAKIEAALKARNTDGVLTAEALKRIEEAAALL